MFGEIGITVGTQHVAASWHSMSLEKSEPKKLKMLVVHYSVIISHNFSILFVCAFGFSEAFLFYLEIVY
jgi:hypothetical protein